MTEFLFQTPSFIEGMARVLDINGTFDSYNRSGTPAEADMVAISNDWQMVGNDLRDALKIYKEQLQKS